MNKPGILPNYLNGTYLPGILIVPLTLSLLDIFTAPVNSFVLRTSYRPTCTRQGHCCPKKANDIRIPFILQETPRQNQQLKQNHDHVLRVLHVDNHCPDGDASSFSLTTSSRPAATAASASTAICRRSLLHSATKKTKTVAAAAAAAATVMSTWSVSPQASRAAPPIAIIAEELGYFPVTNRSGETVFVPAKVRRKSTEQSIQLAQYLRETGAVMYGAYWCPHCSHQKELFGNEAWSLIPYVECSTKGFYYDSSKVEKVKDKIDGFPTWHFPKNGRVRNGKKEQWVSGEMPLERIVVLSGFKGDFDAALEGRDAAPFSSGSCS